jgi:putative FmdB family regulatory protein
MPTYEYGCSDCGHEWEEIQRITAPPTEKCPKCSAPAAHRLISGGTNFILKGGGWYSDLYSSSKSTAKKSDDKGEGTTDTAKKTEAKAEAKTEAAPTKPDPKPSTPPASSE